MEPTLPVQPCVDTKSSRFLLWRTVRLDLDALRAVVGEDTAAMMITNPSTLGIFEPEIAEAASIVHDAGGQMYYDGANFNAILGKTNPGLMGFDAVHYNLHKTFSQPHGGGPGAGPIGVKAHLADYLPAPLLLVKTKKGKSGLIGMTSEIHWEGPAVAWQCGCNRSRMGLLPSLW